ncbi:MAG: hypothetical protein Q7T82_15195 [Armatimonadota bacterium]|nr:hypothetical protein [Armatimonadota bacterium]
MTNLTATPLVGGQCLLQWTNPTDPSFTGCRIVINGDGWPADPNNGMTYEVPAPENSRRNHPVMDNHDYRWRLGRKYFYRVWAHDASNNYSSTAAQVEVTMSDDFVFDDFESYSAGQLQAVGVDHYVLGERDGGWRYYTAPQNNVDQIDVVSGDTHSGSKAALIKNVYGNTLESRVIFDPERSMKTSFGDIQDGINVARLSFWFKSLTGVGDYFWVVTFRDWQGPNDDAFGMVRGSDNKLQFLNTAGGVWTTPIEEVVYTPNVWHHCEIVADTRQSGFGALLADYYLDGDCVAVGTHTGNGSAAKVRCMELWQYQRPASPEMIVLIDDVSIGSAPRRDPLVTGPVGLLLDETPDITWVRQDPNVAFPGQFPPPLYGPYIDPAAVSAHQVRVCFADDPEDPYPAYDSGEVAGSSTSYTCPALPFDIFLWAFVREKYNGGWGPWSRVGTEPFVVVWGECLGPPEVTGPAGPHVGGRPLITFTGCSHDLLRIRVYTTNVDPETAPDPAFDSGDVYSPAFAYPIGPLAAGDYYVYVKLGSLAGWGGWSFGYPLTIDRAGECVDVRHMNEPGILTTNQAAPNDGFGYPLGGFDEGTCTAALSAPACGDRIMVVTDAGGLSGRLLRQHKIASIDLDKGVTVVMAASVDQGGGDTSGGMNWRHASALVGDRDPTGEFRFCAIKMRNSHVGVCSLDSTGTTGDGNYPLRYDWPATTAIRIIRLTGHNSIPGDYSSTVWKLYVNEDPTVRATSTGTMTGSVIEVDAGYRAGWGAQDFIALGQGSTNITGTFQYDWGAVNGGGDYAPGEWDPFGNGAGSYPSIGAAKLPGIESRAVSVTGPAIITKVLTHEEMQGDPPTEVTVQDGYYAQDIAAGGKSLAGVKILTSDAQGGAVAVGARITTVSGVMVEQAGGRVIVNPSATIEGTASFSPVAMAQKALMGPCIDQNLGGGADTTGMMVGFFGKCLLSGFDPNWGTAGAYIFYIDDGSGAADGRELIDDVPIPGIRCLNDAADPLFIPPSVGDYMMVEGIVSYEHAVRASDPLVDLGNVRQILYPVYTILGTGM